MITPRFNLWQDEKSVTIKIRAPYCSLRELEVEVDDNTFLFLCKPYYLRLCLPGSIVENDNTNSVFDSDSGEFTFCYEKVNQGEDFKDLELITKFLVTKVDASLGQDRKITVLASEGKTDEIQNDDDLSTGYGFAMQSNKYFVAVSAEFNDVFEVDPSEVNLVERHKMRLQYDQDKFNISHYLGDYFEDDEILEVIAQKAAWEDLDEPQITFTNKELDFLKDLPNIEYNLSKSQIKYAYNTLIDILYAFCYDQRVNFYEDNAESGWNIVKLAASLSWLDVFDNPKEMLICAFRRSVIYPIHRSFSLSVKVLEDLKKLLALGEKYIIKCFIKIYHIFLTGDCCRYILNNLFIKDYIIYVMKWDKAMWWEFLEEVCKLEIRKEDLGLDLAQIEEQGLSLNLQMSNIHIASETDSDDIPEESSYVSNRTSCNETSEEDTASD